MGLSSRPAPVINELSALAVNGVSVSRSLTLLDDDAVCALLHGQH